MTTAQQTIVTQTPTTDLLLALLKQANASAKLLLALRWQDLSDDELDAAFCVGIKFLDAAQAVTNFRAAQHEQRSA